MIAVVVPQRRRLRNKGDGAPVHRISLLISLLLVENDPEKTERLTVVGAHAQVIPEYLFGMRHITGLQRSNSFGDSITPGNTESGGDEETTERSHNLARVPHSTCLAVSLRSD